MADSKSKQEGDLSSTEEVTRSENNKKRKHDDQQEQQQPPTTKTSATTTKARSLREMVRMGVSKRSDFPLVRSKSALLIIDVQRYCCEDVSDPSSDGYYVQESLPTMVKNIQSLLAAFRRCRDDDSASKNNKDARGCEVIFTVIQSCTNDGRDMSLDYKLSGEYFCRIPKCNASLTDIFLPTIMPNNTTAGRGDIIIPKTACSVFHSTNIDYVLRNLNIEQVVICVQLTEQCVESAVRNAADLGYFVTVVDDACATHSKERHEQGLNGMKGFCRILSTDEVLQELVVGIEESLSK